MGYTYVGLFLISEVLPWIKKLAKLTNVDMNSISELMWLGARVAVGGCTYYLCGGYKNAKQNEKLQKQMEMLEGIMKEKTEKLKQELHDEIVKEEIKSHEDEYQARISALENAVSHNRPK